MSITRFTLIIAVLSAFVGLKAQNAKFYISDGVVFKVNGKEVKQPFTGGLNSTQFYPFDINNDGDMDALCFDRNDRKILPFIRVKDSVFEYEPRFESYFPPGFYWYKTADLNSDGKMDIFTLSENSDLLIYKNSTGVSDTVPSFNNLGQQYYRNQYVPPFPILYNGFSLSKTDMPDISDIDGDGDLDILTYDAFYTIYVLYSDARADFNWDKDTFEFQKMDVCFGYFNDFNGVITLGQCPYSEKLKPRHSGGAACLMFDADEDGDKELLQSNIGQKPMWLLKNGKKEYNHQYDTMIYWDSIFPSGTVRATTYEFPAAYLFDVDGDKVQDLVVSPNGFSDVKETEQIWYYRNFGKNNKPDFRYVRNNFIASETIDLGANSAPAFVDIDADGDLDLFVASNGDFALTMGIKDRIAFFENTGTKKQPVFELKNTDYMGLSSKGLSDLIVRFGDVDGDGDADMLLGERMGFVHFYENTAGAGQPVSLTFVTSDLTVASSAPGESNAAPVSFDYNNDNLPDLLVGYYNGLVVLYENTGTVSNPKFTRKSDRAWGMRGNEWQSNTSPMGFSSYGYAVPVVGDLDDDGKVEVIVGGAWGGVRLYRIDGKAYTDSLIADSTWFWQRSFTDSFVPDLGARICPAIADLSGDSFPELMFGLSRGGLIMAANPNTRLNSINRFADDFPFVALVPNPADDDFEISGIAKEDIRELQVYGTDGRLYFMEHWQNGAPGRIKATQLPSGVYIVKVKAKSGIYSGKLIVNHN